VQIREFATAIGNSEYIGLRKSTMEINLGECGECNLGECGSPDTNVSYIGMTTMTLRERFSNHRYQGSIHKHCVEIHGNRPKIDHLLNNTKILYQAQSKFDLPIFEALHIYNLRPKLNENLYDFFCLKLFHRRS